MVSKAASVNYSQGAMSRDFPQKLDGPLPLCRNTRRPRQLPQPHSKQQPYRLLLLALAVMPSPHLCHNTHPDTCMYNPSCLTRAFHCLISHLVVSTSWKDYWAGVSATHVLTPSQSKHVTGVVIVNAKPRLGNNCVLTLTLNPNPKQALIF